MTFNVVGLPNDEKAKHPWMRQLVVPYIVVFSLASVVSVGTLVQKVRLFFQQIRERRRAAHAGDGSDRENDDRGNGPILLDGVEISAEFAGAARIKQLKANFDENRLERRKLFCGVLLGFFEGLYTWRKSLSASKSSAIQICLLLCADTPMVCLSCYYLYMSMQDCLQPPPGGVSTCVSFASWRISTLNTSKSIGMLGHKAGLIEALRRRYEERKRLRVELTLLLAELRRESEPSSSVGLLATPLSVPPNPGVADVGGGASDAQPSANDARHAPAEVAEQGPEFIVARNAASSSDGASSSGTSGSASESASGSVGALRGECPACKRNVYTTDEGRVKEGNAYYHAGCVKGVCTKCNNNVYGDQARSREGDAYYHLECPP
jgi:hypothetical protein